MVTDSEMIRDIYIELGELLATVVVLGDQMAPHVEFPKVPDREKPAVVSPLQEDLYAICNRIWNTRRTLDAIMGRYEE